MTFSSTIPPKYGQCDQPQIIGASVGAATIRRASPPPWNRFLRIVVPKWLPARTRLDDVLLPRQSIVFPSIRVSRKPEPNETRVVPFGKGESSRNVVGEIACAIVRHCPAPGPARIDTTSPTTGGAPWGAPVRKT